MSESRRRFLKELGCTALGASIGFPLLDHVERAAKDPHLATAPGAAPTSLPPTTRQWGMVVDVEKCLRDEVRRACIEACDLEHNVPRIPDPKEVVEWTWSEPYADIFADEVHAHTPETMRRAPVLVLCNHCTNPPCVRVCPTGATFKRSSDGIVMMDEHRCIGCRYCMAACPYEARSFNWRDPRPYVPKDADGKLLSDYPTRTKGVVEKCTFCAQRIDQGRLPACVEAANAVPGGQGALVFGDVNDPDSDVSRVLRERNTVCRKVSLGTGPNVYYILPAAFPVGDGEA